MPTPGFRRIRERARELRDGFAWGETKFALRRQALTSQLLPHRWYWTHIGTERLVHVDAVLAGTRYEKKGQIE